MDNKITLAIESSCDETSAAVLRGGREVLSLVISTQIPVHQKFGGVVPEIASRKHIVNIMPVIDEALHKAGVSLQDVDQVAVTYGPGLVGALLVGVSAAKGLAWALDLPCCGVSTLEAMAENVRDFEGTVICAMDARRQQIYNAVFDCREGVLSRRCEDRAVALEVLAEDIINDKNRKIIVGDGAKLCYTVPINLREGSGCWNGSR